jgi:hypothetical protein
MIVADGLPGLPGNPQDERADDEADDGVGAWRTDGNGSGDGDDAERNEPVAAGVLTVSDEGSTAESPSGAQADTGGDFVADEPDASGEGERGQMIECLRMHEAVQCFGDRDRGRSQDHRHDGETRPTFSASTAEHERDAERDCRERVAAVVDQIRQQRDRTRQHKHHRLESSGGGKHRKADRDGPDPFPRTNDRSVDQTMCVTVAGILIGAEWKPSVTMWPVAVVGVCPEPMTVGNRAGHSLSTLGVESSRDLGG